MLEIVRFAPLQLKCWTVVIFWISSINVRLNLILY